MSFRLVETGWENEFTVAAAAVKHELRIVAPFLQPDAAKKLVTKKLRELAVLTRFNLDDFCAGVSSLDALDWLVAQGAEIRGIQNLHAKAYLFDNDRAVVTSANLTTAALVRNHELGFITTDVSLAAECRAYFDRLWSKGRILDATLLAEIRLRVETARRIGGGIPARNKLGDLGAKIGLPPSPLTVSSAFPLGETAYVKFFRSSNKGDRAPRRKPTVQDVADCGSHWACTYPGHRAPRRLNDGDTMFIARLVEDPDDILIYGRAVACQHDPAKDVATEADIVRHPWKANWPNYIRVHDAEFLAGTLSNGISLRKLAEELGDSCFASTEERAAKGEAGINPLTTLGQKPDVRLSERGKLWIHEQLEAAFTRHGRIPEADMAALDWPISPLRPNREIAHQLSPAALKLLQLLIEIVRDKDFVPGRSQIGYEETLHALGIPVAEGRAGQQLKQHGLVELAECLNDLKLPAITGIIVNISGQRRNLPGGEYYEAFGKNDGDEIWRLSEIRKSMGWDWNSISRK